MHAFFEYDGSNVFLLFIIKSLIRIIVSLNLPTGGISIHCISGYVYLLTVKIINSKLS